MILENISIWVKNNLLNDFLYISNIYVHWKLDTRRYEFPNAVNIVHITNNKWTTLKDFYNFKILNNKDDICKQINESGISIIFTYNKSRNIK